MKHSWFFFKVTRMKWKFIKERKKRRIKICRHKVEVWCFLNTHKDEWKEWKKKDRQTCISKLFLSGSDCDACCVSRFSPCRYTWNIYLCETTKKKYINLRNYFLWISAMLQRYYLASVSHSRKSSVRFTILSTGYWCLVKRVLNSKWKVV